MTDAKVLDAQSGYESAITNLLCALAGTNFIQDAAGLLNCRADLLSPVLAYHAVIYISP